MFDIPIAFFIYNRAQHTKRVFEAIRTIGPRRLIVVADGPKNVADTAGCNCARRVTEYVDWDCDVRRLYSDVNLGCKQRVSTGLACVFDLHDQAIILEDDCVPEPTFFQFASELLERFRDDERVTCISGDCHVPVSAPFSYAFTRFTFIWGWATWRRAWMNYDIKMKAWPHLRNTDWLESALKSRTAAAILRQTFDRVASGAVDTWDTQWLFSSLLQGGYGIIPTRNLITNIGWGQGATHTKQDGCRLANMVRRPIVFPLSHPVNIAVDEVLERKLFEAVWGSTSSSALRVWAASRWHRIRSLY